MMEEKRERVVLQNVANHAEGHGEVAAHAGKHCLDAGHHADVPHNTESRFFSCTCFRALYYFVFLPLQTHAGECVLRAGLRTY